MFDEADEIYIRRNFLRPEPHILGAPMMVNLPSQYKEIPPPNPLLLALHAACARVAHMSGAAEYFNQIERDTEDMKVLASDGSSARLLSSLLSPFASAEVVFKLLSSNKRLSAY